VPFTGGVDARQVPAVAQIDLDGVRNQLLPRLERQVLQKIQQQLTAGETIAVAPTYSVTDSASKPVGTQADHVQVTVNVSGSAIIYNRNTATHLAIQLLNKDALQTLGSMYEVQGTPVLVSDPTVHPGKNGVVFLSITVKGLWIYNLTPQTMSKWPQVIKGSTTQAAMAFLSVQPGVKSVEINLPFGTDHLPSSVSEIKIVLVNSSGATA